MICQNSWPSLHRFHVSLGWQLFLCVMLMSAAQGVLPRKKYQVSRFTLALMMLVQGPNTVVV